ncbi:MAG TPA: farnesyl diphosphate synthase [Tissierellaceae bacterium]|nr:farnesyl diphosphate synthase [Tissierellaceae bacterium]
MTIIENKIIENRKIIDKAIKNYLNINSIYQDKILESMEYSLFTGGKRLRPIIALEVFKMFNDNLNIIIPYASSIEMIHTYSLIHDDLPSMDNDKIRRGKPTNHIVFGEAMAILTGDALLNYAFEIISTDMYKNSHSLEEYKNKSRAIMEISRYSGLHGMIGGQVVDLFSSHQSIDEKTLLFMYKAKTAALFQASIVSSAIIGGASDEEIDILREFALYMGISYQIQDDLLDAEEDSKIGKFTYLNHFNEKESIKDMIKYTDKSKKLLKKLKNKDTTFLQELINILINRKR